MQHLWLPDLVRFSFDAPKIEFDSTEPKDAAHLLSEVRRHFACRNVAFREHGKMV